MNYTIISRLCKILFLISSHFVDFSYSLWVLYLEMKSITIKIVLGLSSFLHRRTVISQKGDIGFEKISEVVFSSRSGRGSDRSCDSDFTEDEDFDLDVDLKPASEREYVSLSREADTTDERTSDEASDETDAEK